MSDYERNKGKLIPFDLTEDVAEQLVRAKGKDLKYDSYLEQFKDDPSWYTEDIVQVGRDWFKVQWEVKREYDVPEFAEAVVNDDGTIDFHTYHYNGGAHWTEVVEGALDEV